MKITVNMSTIEGKYRRYPITAYCPFEMYGHTFAVHRSLEAAQGSSVSEDIVPKKYGHTVTETETGFMCTEGMTRKEAIEKAKKGLQNMGEERFYKNLAWSREQISRKAEGRES